MQVQSVQFHATSALTLGEETPVTLRTEGRVDALEKRKTPNRCLEPNHISLAVQPVAYRCCPLLAGYHSGTAMPKHTAAARHALHAQRISAALSCHHLAAEKQ